MKILFVIDSLKGGGAEKSTQVICDYLYKNKVNFKVVCVTPSQEGFYREMVEKGFDIQFLREKSFWGQTKEISGIIKKGDYDIVHSILFRSNIRTRFAKLFVNFFHLESVVSTVYSKERTRFLNPFKIMFYKSLDRFSSGCGVDHFHSISYTVKKHYENHLNIPTGKITVVYRGRKSFFDKMKSPRNDSSKFVLLNVGRQEPAKGQIYILKAMKLLINKGELDISLTLLGISGSETDKLQSYVDENNLKDYVNFEGFSSEVQQYYLGADVFIFSSLFEGLGGALIEAQSAGLPIVANDLEVLREVAVEYKNALFVDIKDSECVAQAILKLKNSPELRSEFSENSLRNYTEKFKEEVSNEEMLKLYKKLCKNATC